MKYPPKSYVKAYENLDELLTPRDMLNYQIFEYDGQKLLVYEFDGKKSQIKIET